MRLIEGDDGLVCDGCGQPHEGLATVFGPDAPDAWHGVPQEVRWEGGLSPDQCFLTWQGRDYEFIRGHLRLPIVDQPGEEFSWSVWSTVAAADSALLEQLWDSPERANIPRMKGRLANELPYADSTLGLPLEVQHRAPGEVPLFFLAPEVQHVMATEQREGIPWHRVAEINEQLLG